MKNKKIIVTVCISLILLINFFYLNIEKTTSNEIKSIKTSDKIINITSSSKIEKEETTKKIITTNTKEATTSKVPKPIPTTTTTKPILLTTNKITIATTQKNSTTNKIEKTTSSVVSKSLKEQNQTLINEIKQIYGYEVSYNDEEFWFNGVPCTQLTDEEKANKALIDLKNKSAIFPNGFFKTFQGYNGFRIILYEHIEGAAGVASYEIGNDNFIAIDINNEFLGRVFYHETFHIMEQYIRYSSYGKTNPFDSWNNLNLVGFTYHDDDTFNYTVYDFNDFYKYDNPENISFVSKYAKTNDREDRAELFADLMFRAIKKEYMTSGFGVNNKAKSLSLILREFFPNSIGARWEKYIDWS